MNTEDVDPSTGFDGLKDFQRDTVEYVFSRLWGCEDPVERFLVADEVGLGKTMVAKGLIAKTVEHLSETDDRIDIVYICSNAQIARQNLARLNIVGGSELHNADRLTLLPKVMQDLRSQQINLVSFTPGTSFHVGSSGGTGRERVLLYWMLASQWGKKVTRPARWKKFFEGGMQRENFSRDVADFDRSALDADLCRSFVDAIDDATGPDGGSLRDELEACVLEFNYLRGKPNPDLGRKRNQLVGKLRQLVARSAVDQLKPDLVILDEFQRFKDLLDADNDSAQLANAIFEYPGAKALLLSATPYKMYTLPDEPEGDDHYRDFTRTVRFLAGDERAHIIERELRSMREALVMGNASTPAYSARDQVEHELRRVMSRTERLASTPDRDGMLAQREFEDVQLTTEDLRAWQTLDDIARQIHSQDVFEYWRSSPYVLNMMEPNSYKVGAKFQAAVERNDRSVRRCIAEGSGLLNWDDIRYYQQVDPGNAKLRGLIADVLDRGAWRLAWLPPSLPYYHLGGAYGEPQLRDFTKRLLFSAWTLVPKSVTAMLSYEAERRTIKHANSGRRYDDRPPSPRLRFPLREERPAGMPVLALVYPSSTLAHIGDPLQIARASQLPVATETLLSAVRERVRNALKKLPAGEPTELPDQRWYWAAPFMLDLRESGDVNNTFVDNMRQWDGYSDEGQATRLSMHLDLAQNVNDLNLGKRPDDLEEILASMATAGPGVCALRALSRVTEGRSAVDTHQIRFNAYRVAHGLRSLFNKPEIIALVGSGDDGFYWRQVLDHCFDGCIQAVLDEYAHVLIESEGLQNAGVGHRAGRLADTITEALSIRTAANGVDDVHVTDGRIRIKEQRINSHIAARYGRAQSADSAANRETTVRTAYNSPFRPFVLASTSAGQEGLDFHTYSHAVVHWNLPGNPVDLEQREGRVHRYKGHAVRKNVAAEHWNAALKAESDDPWAAVFDAAEYACDSDDSDIKPYWIYTRPGGAMIERYVPALPLSRESQRYRRLQRTVAAYRLVIGQPRQNDLVQYTDADTDWMRIDLTPPSSQRSA